MPSYKPGPGIGRPRYAGKVVRVTWEDAFTSSGSRSISVEELDQDWVVQTFGVCIQEGRKGLTVAQNCDEDGRYRDTMFVPWGVVTGVRVYATEWKVRR